MKYFEQDNRKLPLPVISFDEAARVIVNDSHWQLLSKGETFIIADREHTITVHCENIDKPRSLIRVWLSCTNSQVLHVHEARIETHKPHQEISQAIATLLLHALVINGEWRVGDC